MANLQLGVLVLGAGASSRMGRPKLLLPWGSTTVIGHILSQWQTLGAEQIAVVIRENDFAPAEELNRLKFSSQNRIVNPQPERGMFSSVVYAAEWNGWKKEISSFAIVLGDQPHLKTETLRALLEYSTQNPDAICQPEFHGREKHPVILPREIFSALKGSRAGSLKDFLAGSNFPRARLAEDDAGLQFDLDTPEDFARLKNLED